jgi:hypothetical protein
MNQTGIVSVDGRTRPCMPCIPVGDNTQHDVASFSCDTPFPCLDAVVPILRTQLFSQPSTCHVIARGGSCRTPLSAASFP